jgi:ABC-type dipeptide/oligopeptide/nickel transport system permease component
LLGIVFVISVGSFYLIHLLPGNPAVVILGNAYNAEAKAALYKQLGLNKPIIEQYFVWIGHVLHGNLGTSFISRVSVGHHHQGGPANRPRDDRHQPGPGLAIADPMRCVSARKPDGTVDRVLGAGSFTLLSMPPFIIIVAPGAASCRSRWGSPTPVRRPTSPFGTDWVTNLESVSPASITWRGQLRALLPRAAQ